LSTYSIKLEEIGKYSKRLLAYNPKIKKTYTIDKKKKPKILRVLCQRPYFTGSGINLINLTKKTAKKGLEQFVIFGHPNGEPNPLDDIIGKENTLPVIFSGEGSTIEADIPFPVVGMSDQMPYESTKFSDFDEKMLEIYLDAFANNIKTAVEQFKPDIIHSHHLWLVTSLCKVLNPNLPVVATCHNTGLRQMELASQLRDFMLNPIKGIDAIAVIDTSQQERVKRIYEFDNNHSKADQFFHIGQGINTTIFCPPSSTPQPEVVGNKFTIIYVGKLSFSKGVPQLIEAFKQLTHEEEIHCKLLLVGSGKGEEKDTIYEMANDMDNIQFLGQLEQEELSNYFRKSDLFVLPSFYDGFPKVLLESLSSGCRAIITDLPGIKNTLQKTCGDSDIVQYVPLPEMKSIDEPKEEALPDFIEKLKILMREQIRRCKTTEIDYNYANRVKREFSQEGLFQKYLDKYKALLS